MILDKVQVRFASAIPTSPSPAIPHFNLGPFVKSIAVSRGRGNRFGNYPSGTARIVLNNEDRRFDPTYDYDFGYMGSLDGQSGIIDPANWNPSLYVGKRFRVQLGHDGESVAVNPIDRPIFTGFVSDWSFVYTPDGYSEAILTLEDGTALLANTIAEQRTDPLNAQLTGERITQTLLQSNVLVRGGAEIDTGEVTLGTQPIPENTRLMDYLNLVATTEGGQVFLDRFGVINFHDRSHPAGTAVIEFGSGSPDFRAIETDFGFQLVYNQVTVQNTGGSAITVEDSDSIDDYGVRNLTLSGLIGNDDDEAQLLGEILISKYSDPAYRITGMEVNVNKYDEPGAITALQSEIIQKDIGDYGRIRFTPSGIGTELVQDKMISAIQHTITPESWVVVFGLDETLHDFLILDDEVFGYLDKNLLG